MVRQIKNRERQISDKPHSLNITSAIKCINLLFKDQDIYSFSEIAPLLSMGVSGVAAHPHSTEL